MKEDKIVVLIPEYKSHQPPEYSSITSDEKKKTKVRIYKTPRRVIPILFLPGVMGSNLKSIEDDSSIWKSNSTWSMIGWALKGPIERTRLLDPATTIIDPSGYIITENEEEFKIVGSRFSRGWGEVGAMSYGDFLPWLQGALNDHSELIENRTENSNNKTLREKFIDGINNPLISELRLTADEVALSYKYYFPVHAVGYNWLQSNKDSAHHLSEKVNEIISDYRSEGFYCEKVILVTHSMGGLVARHYSECMGGCENIFGIVHGVMPDQGSPMAYKRMKTGEEIPVGLVIGSNGEELTPVLAKSPGPLQLLPSINYGLGWLKVEGMEYALPRKEPYGEIYLERSAWWGLCEERFLHPKKKNKNITKYGREMDAEWNRYDFLISNQVKPFIENLFCKYHSQTYSFYGCDGGKYPSYETILWKAVSKKQNVSELSGRGVNFHPPEVFNKTIRYPGVITDDNRMFSEGYKLAKPDANGDGTVPSKAALLKKHLVKTQLALSVDHEGAFKLQEGNEMNSRWFTLWSILKIAQGVKGTGMSYEE